MSLIKDSNPRLPRGNDFPVDPHNVSAEFQEFAVTEHLVDRKIDTRAFEQPRFEMFVGNLCRRLRLRVHKIQHFRAALDMVLDQLIAPDSQVQKVPLTGGKEPVGREGR